MRSRWLPAVGLIPLGVAITMMSFPQQLASGRPQRIAASSARLTLPVTQKPATTTTIAPGSLSQTEQLPKATDPTFIAHMRELVSAVASNHSATGKPAFFPLPAYIQVKGIVDPVHDWNTRLIANYAVDIGLLHHQLGAKANAAKFVSVTVPDDATWVLPGVEYNKGSYWRVYGAVVHYQIGTATSYFVITSMISWRGEWYVVHLGKIR